MTLRAQISTYPPCPLLKMSPLGKESPSLLTPSLQKHGGYRTQVSPSDCSKACVTCIRWQLSWRSCSSRQEVCAHLTQTRATPLLEEVALLTCVYPFLHQHKHCVAWCAARSVPQSCSSCHHISKSSRELL